MTIDTYALTSVANVKTHLGISASTWDTLFENLINAASARVESFIDRKIKSRTFIEIHDPMGSDAVQLRQRPITGVKAVGYGVRPVLSVSIDTAGTVIMATARVIPDLSTGSFANLVLTRATATGDPSSGSASTARSASGLVTALNSNPWTVALIGADVRSDFLHAVTVDVTNSTGYLTCPAYFDAAMRFDLRTGTVYRSNERDDWTDEYPTDPRVNFGYGAQTMMVQYVAGYATVPYDIEQTTIELVAAMFKSRQNNEGLSSESLGDYSYVNAGSAVYTAMLEERLSGWRSIR